MFSGQRAALLGALGVLVGLVLIGGFAAPEVTAFGPDSGSPHVPASAPIRIEFDRPMDRISVETRLSMEPAIPGEITWEGNTLLYRPIESWPTGQDILVGLEAGARSTRFLPLLRSLDWSFQVGEPRLAYLWPSGGPSELYLLDLTSQKRSRLTETEAGVIDYSIGLDGTSIVYTALLEDGGSEIWLMDLETGSDELLYACSSASRCQAGAISPDGTLLAFEQIEWETSAAGRRVPGARQVWLMPIGPGGQPTRVQPEEQVTSSPDWSPDGILTFYNGSLGAVIFLEPEGLQPLNLVPNGLGLLGSWSPDGDYLILPEIVFPTEADASGQADFFSHLYRVEAATMDIKDLSIGTVEDASPVYSPDGEWIAFGRKFLDERWTPGRQVWIMRADGSQPRPITDEPDLSHASLAWNPDSTRIAYMRLNQADPNEMPEIWMTNLEGKVHEFLVEGGYLPQWIP
ncbi:MAG: Ig-like domain-containing protein [Anaerolineales bacterium]